MAANYNVEVLECRERYTIHNVWWLHLTVFSKFASLQVFKYVKRTFALNRLVQVPTSLHTNKVSYSCFSTKLLNASVLYSASKLSGQFIINSSFELAGMRSAELLACTCDNFGSIKYDAVHGYQAMVNVCDEIVRLTLQLIKQYYFYASLIAELQNGKLEATVIKDSQRRPQLLSHGKLTGLMN